MKQWITGDQFSKTLKDIKDIKDSQNKPTGFLFNILSIPILVKDVKEMILQTALKA